MPYLARATQDPGTNAQGASVYRFPGACTLVTMVRIWSTRAPYYRHLQSGGKDRIRSGARPQRREVERQGVRTRKGPCSAWRQKELLWGCAVGRRSDAVVNVGLDEIRMCEAGFVTAAEGTPSKTGQAAQERRGPSQPARPISGPIFRQSCAS